MRDFPSTPPPALRKDDRAWVIGTPITRVFVDLFFRLRVEGLEHFPPSGGGILASNHVSVLDPVFLCLASSDQGRTLRFLAKSESFRVPIVGWGLRTLKQIPIVRGGSDVAALEAAIGVIRSGGLIGIYPEGRVGPGPMQPGRRGAARLALASGCPIYPVGTWGANARWPRSGLHLSRPLRPLLSIVIGPPVVPEGDPGSPDDVRRLTDRLMTALGEQAAAARRIAPLPRLE